MFPNCEIVKIVHIYFYSSLGNMVGIPAKLKLGMAMWLDLANEVWVKVVCDTPRRKL